jgi:hypothetical protein
MKTKVKKKSLSKLQENLWKVFSEWIRRRDSDEYGIVKCFTCGKKSHWKEMQAGHFITRKQSATKYDEVNVQVQCVSCNIFGQGMQFIFGRNLDLKYGEGTADQLEFKSKLMCKRDRFDYEMMIDDVKQKIKAL